MSKYNSDTQTNGRDPQSGRFLSGNNGGGRPKGSRNKLSEEFLADLCNEWQRNGKVALERMCANHPEQFCKLVGSLLPARIDQTLSVDVDLFAKAKTFAEAYRLAKRYIGAEDSQPLIELTPEATDD